MQGTMTASVFKRETLHCPPVLCCAILLSTILRSTMLCCAPQFNACTVLHHTATNNETDSYYVRTVRTLGRSSEW